MILWWWACGEAAAPPVASAPVADAAPRVALRPCVPGALSPLAIRPDEAVDTARATLDGIVRDHARDPENPWAVAHALLGLGPGFRLTNEREPVGWLYERYAILDDARLPDFPTRVGDIRVEPHTDLLLKSVVESGLSPATPVVVQGQERTLEDAWWGAVGRTWATGDVTSAGSWNDMPWSWMAIAGWAPARFTWHAGDHPMSADGFSAALVAKLRAETAFLREARAAGGTFRKQRQGIFAYTCGGAHLLQGAAYGVARGFGSDADRTAVVDEIRLLLWRFPHEMRQIDEALRSRPDLGLVLVSQRMKFLGHTLETVHRASAWGIFQPDDLEKVTLAGTLVELVRTMAALERMGVPASLPTIRASNEQLFLDYVGDAAHALKGLDLATGRASVCR